VVDVDYSTHWVSATGSNPKLRKCRDLYQTLSQTPCDFMSMP
jgi:hypothetical protein